MYGQHMLRAVAIAALLLAGCGTTTPKRSAQSTTPAATTAAAVSTPSPTPTVTHAEFVKALNASCVKGDAKAGDLENRFESAMERSALREAGGLYKEMMSVLRAHVRRIEVLDAPANDSSAMRQYIRAERRILGYGDRMSRSLLDNDLADVQLLVHSFQKERTRRITAAIDMGADKCGG